VAPGHAAGLGLHDAATPRGIYVGDEPASAARTPVATQDVPGSPCGINVGDQPARGASTLKCVRRPPADRRNTLLACLATTDAGGFTTPPPPY
jgi:hypothetical protein